MRRGSTVQKGSEKNALWPWVDDLGPAKTLYLHDPDVGLEAIVVLDNLTLGPVIGGVRMVPDVTPWEVFSLARSMTFKAAAAGLPLGGGKAGILAEPSAVDREALIKAFARGIKELTEYIPAPDMGTDENLMGIIWDEIGRAAGLPRAKGGIPLNEVGATGFGLAECAEVAAAYLDMDLHGARIVVEGFGNVGYHVARFLTQKGCVLVGASDINGLLWDPDGLDLDVLNRARREAGTIWTSERNGKRMAREEIFSLPCEIFIPAARPETLNGDNAAKLQARLVVEGANVPATSQAEQILNDRRILVIPDFIANAGGLVCASVEWDGGDEKTAFAVIKKNIVRNTNSILEGVQGWTVLPRTVAIDLALRRLRKPVRGPERAKKALAEKHETLHRATGS